jgi:hypothetical protein
LSTLLSTGRIWVGVAREVIHDPLQSPNHLVESADAIPGEGLHILLQGEDSRALLIIDPIDLSHHVVITRIDVPTDLIEMPNEVLREGALGVEVISEEEFTNNFARNPLEKRNKLSEGSASMAWDNRGGQLSVVGVVLINEPELLGVLKVPNSNVPILCETGRGPGELAVLVATSLHIRFDSLSDLAHEGANVLYRELSRRGVAVNSCLTLNCFLLRQLSHLL